MKKVDRNIVQIQLKDIDPKKKVHEIRNISFPILSTSQFTFCRWRENAKVLAFQRRRANRLSRKYSQIWMDRVAMIRLVDILVKKFPTF